MKSQTQSRDFFVPEACAKIVCFKKPKPARNLAWIADMRG